MKIALWRGSVRVGDVVKEELTVDCVLRVPDTYQMHSSRILGPSRQPSTRVLPDTNQKDRTYPPHITLRQRQLAHPIPIPDTFRHRGARRSEARERGGTDGVVCLDYCVKEAVGVKLRAEGARTRGTTGEKQKGLNK